MSYQIDESNQQVSEGYIHDVFRSCLVRICTMRMQTAMNIKFFCQS